MKTSKRMVAALAATAAAALILTGCGASGDSATNDEAKPAGETTTVTVGTFPIVDIAPLYVGQEQGFFEEEGIDLEIEFVDGGANAVSGVVSGQLDVSFSNVSSLLLAASKELPLRIIAPGLYTTGVDLEDSVGVAVPADSDIEDMLDLQGKRIGVSALNNIADTTIRAAVDGAGGDSSTIEFVEIVMLNMIATIDRGDLDAAWLPEPFLSQYLASGARQIFSPNVLVDENLMPSAYFSSAAYVDANPEVLERFQRALGKSLDYSQENPEAVRAAVATYSELPEEALEALTLPLFKNEMNEESVVQLSDLSVRYGLISEDFDPLVLFP